MSTVICPVGHVINLSNYPNQHEYVLFGSWVLDHVMAAIDDLLSSNVDPKTLARDIRRALREVPGRIQLVVCPTCERATLYEERQGAGPLMIWSPPPGLDGLTPTKQEIAEYLRGNAAPYLERIARLAFIVDELLDENRGEREEP